MSILYRQSQNNQIQSALHIIGFEKSDKIASSLQGGIWEGIESGQNTSTKVIKVTSKYLHKNSISTIQSNGNKIYKVVENILMEKAILEYLSQQSNTPKSIIKYIDFFQSKEHYFLIMEHGGRSLWNMAVKAHKLISNGHIDIKEWHKVIKLIFKQMIECIEYIHSKNVCHFDISLENMLINDLQIKETKNHKTNKGQISFILDNLQIKLCDFGLVEYFGEDKCDFTSNKHCGKINYQSPEIRAKKKDFNAKSNDIWCLGICIWMLTVGTSPFMIAHKSDSLFLYMMNGHITQLLKTWNKSAYVDDQWVDLMKGFFQYEDKRISIEQIKIHPWLQ